MTPEWWVSLLQAFVIINLVMGAFAYTTWLERKVLGRMQPVDLVLVEGFKREAHPKLEVYRAVVGKPLLAPSMRT